MSTFLAKTSPVCTISNSLLAGAILPKSQTNIPVKAARRPPSGPILPKNLAWSTQQNAIADCKMACLEGWNGPFGLLKRAV